MSSPIHRITGAQLIAGAPQPVGGGASFRAVAPARGTPIGPEFPEATDEQVMAAASAAAEAFATTQDLPPATIAALLEAVAGGLEAIGDELVELADLETALGPTRLTGELARTCAQLRLFATTVREGSHLDVRIDPADPAATPPRPDLRRLKVARGPVAVFGASNFPLAFSVPGGDTASALAAGCPVVVKAHPSHPATSQRCGEAIAAAIAACGLPAGMFSLLHGRGTEVGRALVLAAPIAAVGFTGSLAGGRALFDLGAARPEPIPVYAEMGSLNPVFLTAAALSARGEELAQGFVASMTLGTGQFCTKPGLAFVPDDEAGHRFEQQVAAAIGEQPAGVLLNAGVLGALDERLGVTRALDGVTVLAEGYPPAGAGTWCAATVLTTDLATYRATAELREEHFGPVSLIVRCPTPSSMVEVARELPGSLTISIHAEPEEVSADTTTGTTGVAALQAAARGRCGRLIFDQFPTGVAVTPAMHHGGPYPATTDTAHTSVGTAAIERFLRPVCYQNAPAAALPPALRDDNPLGLPRTIDGRRIPT